MWSRCVAYKVLLPARKIYRKLDILQPQECMNAPRRLTAILKRCPRTRSAPRAGLYIGRSGFHEFGQQVDYYADSGGAKSQGQKPAVAQHVSEIPVTLYRLIMPEKSLPAMFFVLP